MKESTSHSRVVLPLHEQGIAIYSRKSRFTGKGESVGNQIELCRQYLRAHEPDAPEPEIFEDDGFSGGDLNRPAFRRMMRAAEAGRFRMLIVYRLDRISRSIGDFTALIERLAQLNVAFVSIREQFDTSTPMGRAMMYIASVFSQLERETIAERIRDNLRELAKTGRWLGGITPTGFASEAVQAVTVDGRTKRACRLRLLPEEAETVKAMYSLFARLGSLTAVVKGLQERGITTKNGNAFTRHAVRDSDIDGHNIHAGEYLALWGSSLFGSSADLKGLLRSMAEKVHEEGHEFVTVYAGADLPAGQAEEAAALFREVCPECEVTLIDGGQPVYYYLISAE